MWQDAFRPNSPAGNNAAERRAGPTDPEYADHEGERMRQLEVLAQ